MMNTLNKVRFLFLAHGSPMIALENNKYTDLLATIGKTKPKAVIIFTAHWESPVTTISSIDGNYNMIYDFYGFPQELYKVKYPAKGYPELALKIHKNLKTKGILSKLDPKRGLDHGSWTLLYKVFPSADIPVVQMSVDPFLDPKKQFEIGRALKELDDDIMVIGSGVSVHNLRMVDWNATVPDKWAVQFDDWLIEKITKKDDEAVANYMSLAPNAKKAVPRSEHFVPLLIAYGGTDASVDPKPIYKDYEYGSLSYLSFEFS